MKHVYKPKGVCSSQVEFELEGNVVKNINFRGGCNGNLKAIAALAKLRQKNGKNKKNASNHLRIQKNFMFRSAGSRSYGCGC